MPWTEKLPSGRYRAGYRLPNGDKLYVKGTFTHKVAARSAAIEAEGKVQRPGWRDPRVGLMTWGEWHALWWDARGIEPSTSSSESSMVDTQLMPRWGGVPLVEINRHDVKAWAMGMLKENIGTEEKPRYRKPATARRYLNVLVSSLTAAVDKELIVANPAVGITLPTIEQPEPVFLSREQYAALAAAVLVESDRAMLDFLVGTGLRWGEAAGLHWHHLDLKAGTVTVRDNTDGREIKPYPKGRRKRYVPVLQWVVDYLETPSQIAPCGLPHRHLKSCPSGLVFSSHRGGVQDDRNFTQRVLQPALKSAGLEDLGVSLHDLRHTYASWLVQDGVPLQRVGELLGHSTVKVTEIYAHLKPPTADDVAAALPRPEMKAPAPTVAAGEKPLLRALN